MRRKPEKRPSGSSAIQKQQQELDRQAEQLRAKLDKTRQFLAKVPEIKEEVQRKQQRAIYDRFNRPARVEGAVDFKLRYVAPKSSAPPRRLRRERTKTPFVTLFLLVIFAAVVWFVFRSVWLS